MHVIGFFFDIDPFARVGTSLGEPLVFPVELVLPQRCEQLVTELVLDTRIGDIGLRLEAHFLKGYRRAAERGAIGLARPAQITQRGWVLDLLPPAEVVGRTWLHKHLSHKAGRKRGQLAAVFRRRSVDHQQEPRLPVSLLAGVRSGAHRGRRWGAFERERRLVSRCQ